MSHGYFTHVTVSTEHHQFEVLLSLTGGFKLQLCGCPVVYPQVPLKNVWVLQDCCPAAIAQIFVWCKPKNGQKLGNWPGL